MTGERQPAYAAVYEVIRRFPARSTDSYGQAVENARVWRAVEAALDAMEPGGQSTGDGDQATATVLGEVYAERRRQDEKWGEQNHHHADPVILRRLPGPGQHLPAAVAARLAQHYEIPTAGRARYACQVEASNGTPTWVGIAIEELAEALEATTSGSADAVRAEWVQLAAVAVAAVEAIDRRTAAEQRSSTA